jgi:uncharacterized protein (DUF1499 family)
MRLLRLFALFAAAGAVLAVASRATTTDPPDFAPRSAMSQNPPPENPLPECPSSPNCVRLTQTCAADADRLFAAAKQAIDSTGGKLTEEDTTSDPALRTLRATYRAFVFTDDVVLAVEPYEGGSALHLRSASRVGRSDLGVNGRRAKKVVAAVEEALGG